MSSETIDRQQHSGNGRSDHRPEARAPALADAEWTDWARSRASTLAERAPGCEAARTVAPETIAEFKAAGIFNFLKPARFGGIETTYTTFLSVVEELAVGCASSSWVYSVTTETNWIVASFGAQAQQDVWGSNPSAISCGVLFPRGGPARRVAGGYRLSGQWAFASGSDYADWVVLGTRIEDDPTGATQYMLIPMSDVELIDDWQVLGLRATGSRSVRVSDVFIPDHRALPVASMERGESAGSAYHPDFALGRVPRLYLAIYTLSANSLGLGRRTLELVSQYVADRTGPGSMPSSVVTNNLAEGATKISQARKLIYADVRSVEEAMRDGSIDQIDTGILARDLSYSMQGIRSAIEMLADITGSQYIYDGHPVQVAVRDVVVASRHKIANWDLFSNAYVRSVLAARATT